MLGSAVLAAPLGAQWKPEWEKHCDACIGYYTSNSVQKCLKEGGRACLMVRAIRADGTAREHLKAAGPRAVCGYLMAK